MKVTLFQNCWMRLPGIVTFIGSLIHCFHVYIISFSIVITWGQEERELVALLFRYFVMFVVCMYIITCFCFLFPLEGYDLCVCPFLHMSIIIFSIQKVTDMLRASPLQYRGSYTRGHFIWNLWNKPVVSFINFVWNDHECNILFIIWPF